MVAFSDGVSKSCRGHGKDKFNQNLNHNLNTLDYILNYGLILDYGGYDKISGQQLKNRRGFPFEMARW